MPTTYNGVGTHYYGKKHKKTRDAVCQQCGHKTELTSYETRLWFVFFFIPILPFGRKRITDQCKVCSRHYAVPAKQWETGRQSATAAAMEQFRKEQSEEAALDVHATLLAFQQHDEANEFRATIVERFADKALLHAGLATQMENAGLPEVADPLWDKAWELDPKLPATRIGMARRRMFEDKLDEAHELLQFLEVPGAQQQYDLNPLFDLAHRYQTKSEHQKALDIMGVLLKAYPDLSSDHKIRAFVKKSEKAIKREASTLPPVEHSMSKLFSSQYSSNTRWVIGISAALILATIGMAINNEYIRRHQPLTVINETGVPATIQIDDRPPVSVMGMQTLTMNEGQHIVKVSGPVTEEHQLDVESGYFQRWSNTPVWIVNVNGEAIIADMQLHYAVNPRPPTINFVVDSLIVRAHVDHPFEEPPESLDVGSKNAVRTLTALSWLDLGAAPGSELSAFLTLQEKNPAVAFNYARNKLQRDPNNADLMQYVSSQIDDAQRQPFLELLESKLEHRPVAVEWHRTYQELPSVSANYIDLISRYESMLQNEPDNAALLYLRARIDKAPAHGLELTTRSLKADPEFSYAHYSMGYRHLSAGQWQAALDSYDKALATGGREANIRHYRHYALMGLGQYTELEATYRTELSDNPAAVQAAISLGEILTSTDRADEAVAVIESACTAFEAEANGNFLGQVHGARSMAAYYTGDVAKSWEEARKVDDRSDLADRIAPESPAFVKLAAEYTASGSRVARWNPLIYAIAFAAAGKTDQANAWHRKAAQQFEALGEREELLARALTADPDAADSVAQAAGVQETPMEKAILLTHLGLRCSVPELKDRYLQEAKRYLVRLNPPYLLLRRVLEAASSKL